MTIAAFGATAADAGSLDDLPSMGDPGISTALSSSDESSPACRGGEQEVNYQNNDPAIAPLSTQLRKVMLGTMSARLDGAARPYLGHEAWVELHGLVGLLRGDLVHNVRARLTKAKGVAFDGCDLRRLYRKLPTSGVQYIRTVHCA